MENFKHERNGMKKVFQSALLIGLLGLASCAPAFEILNKLKQSDLEINVNLGLTSIGIKDFSHNYAGNSSLPDREFFILPTDFFDGKHYQNGHVIGKTRIKVQNFLGLDVWTEQDLP